MTFELPEPVRRAIAIYAAERKLSVGQVVSWMTSECIPDFLARAEKLVAETEPEKPTKGRPRRKP